MYVVHERRGVVSWTAVSFGAYPGLHGKEWLWRTVPTIFVRDVQAHVRAQCADVRKHLQVLYPGVELAWRQKSTLQRDPTPRMVYHIEATLCIDGSGPRPAMYLIEFVIDGPGADELPPALLDA